MLAAQCLSASLLGMPPLQRRLAQRWRTAAAATLCAHRRRVSNHRCTTEGTAEDVADALALLACTRARVGRCHA